MRLNSAKRIDSYSQNEAEFQFVLIGNSENVLRNLPLSLKLSGFKVLGIAPKQSHLIRSEHLTKTIQINGLSSSEFVANLKPIEQSLKDLNSCFLWSSDEIMKVAAESNLDLDCKINILPIKNPEYWRIFDSKAAQSEVFSSIGIKQPKTKVYKSAFHSIENEWKFDSKVLIKGNSSGGGAFIQEFLTAEELDLRKVNANWFPLSVQEFIPGNDLMVEAYFKNGELILALASEPLAEASKYGPSVGRQYFRKCPIEAVRTLRLLGSKLAVHGFVNVTFRISNQNGELFLIEFDARPNIWHGVFTELGIPFREIWLDGKAMLESSLNKTAKIYDPLRLFNWSMEKGRLSEAIRAMKGKNSLNFGSPLSSDFVSENKGRRGWVKVMLAPFYPFRKKILRTLILIKLQLPKSQRDSIDGSRLKTYLLKILN